MPRGPLARVIHRNLHEQAAARRYAARTRPSPKRRAWYRARMNLPRPSARALSVLAILAAAVPVALARCSYSFECDRTTAAIVLPEPGDTIVLRGRACVEAADGFTPAAGVYVDGEGGAAAAVRLSVLDPVSGTDVVMDPSYPGADLEVAAVHCDEGITITIENTSSTTVTGLVWLTADVEEHDRCDVFLEAP